MNRVRVAPKERRRLDQRARAYWMLSATVFVIGMLPPAWWGVPRSDGMICRVCLSGVAYALLAVSAYYTCKRAPPRSRGTPHQGTATAASRTGDDTRVDTGP